MNDLTQFTQAELEEIEYSKWVPTNKMKLVVELALTVFPRMTIATICRRVKIDPSTFHKWIKSDKNFARFWGTLHKDIARHHVAGAVAALVRKANTGDVAAVRLLLETAGFLGNHKVEISGPGGKPLQTVNAHLVALPTETLLKMKEMFKELLTPIAEK